MDPTISMVTLQVTPRHRDRDRLVSSHEDLHLRPVSCLAITPDGHTLITGSSDCTIRVWSMSKVSNGLRSQKRQLNIVATLSGHNRKVTSLDVCPKVGILASGGEDCRVVLWDCRSWAFLYDLKGHLHPIVSVSINPVMGKFCIAYPSSFSLPYCGIIPWLLVGTTATLSGAELRIWNVNGILLAIAHLGQVHNFLCRCGPPVIHRCTSHVA